MIESKKPTTNLPQFDVAGAASAVALSLLICTTSRLIADGLGLSSLFILVLTVISLLVANFAKPLLSHVRGDFEVGTLLMYVFFVTIGAGANVAVVFGEALPVLLFILVIIAIHIVILLLFARLLRLDLAEVMIASNACILGPAPAAALAASRGWHSLVAPGIMVGVFGYAIATFIGVSLAAALGAEI